ncbi:electron transfer flavoprotein-ubiquinone oxidoreductase mitochondrial-like [Trifolium pratense]|uniref:Electron transfer flavoprotein-ubiquinone oxidoreductase n=1 Tax=Trifolium pratense TaxID=57577 RepID=A0A2K3KF73_TRIPR|nr:electron transfer flavoprotein-ubiquinone oxidoreductase mitochondrial-like [Trifolium pratense]
MLKFISHFLKSKSNLKSTLSNSRVPISRNFCTTPIRDSIQYDVVIVGAGPAGLSAAIRLKQLCRQNDTDLSVCVLEKGAEVGAHILSGNVFEPRALNELLPQWKQQEAPITTPVSSDKFWFLTKNRAISLPSPFNNEGNYF